jgi:hypothetical protein
VSVSRTLDLNTGVLCSGIPGNVLIIRSLSAACAEKREQSNRSLNTSEGGERPYRRRNRLTDVFISVLCDHAIHDNIFVKRIYFRYIG